MTRFDEPTIRRFRLARLGLAPGTAHPDPVEAARANVGIQSQIESMSLMGLSLRTQGHPDKEATSAVLHDHRQLVRTWGPRDTLHLFAPAHWPLLVAARPEWGKSARFQAPVDPEVMAAATARVAASEVPLGREDLRDLVPTAWLDAFEHPYFDTPDKKWRFATGRMIWLESNEGRLSHGPKRGSEQLYLPRAAFHPGVDFEAANLDAIQAARQLTRAYLASYGPASVHDIAHFFGAKVSSARAWVEGMPELVDVACGDRQLLLAGDDVDALAQAAEGPDGGVRLLPGYDNLLMGHADKSWTVREPAEAKAVWRSAARVAAVVLEHGVIVATWTHKTRAKRVDVAVQPLSGWSAGLRAAVEAEAQRVAAFLGRPEATVTVA